MKDRKVDKRNYQIVIGLAIFSCVYYLFFEPKTIGHDWRYTVFILGLPVLTGTLALGFYRKQALMRLYKANNTFFMRVFLVVFYLLQGVLIAYISFGQAAKITFDMLNARAAKNNPVEIVTADVTRFWTGRSPYSIDFIFRNRQESIKVHYKSIKAYRDENPKEYRVVLECHEGLWNYYLLDNWMVEKK